MGSYSLVGMDDGRFNLAIDAAQAPARPFRQGQSAGGSAFDVTAIDARSLTATDDLLVRATRSSVCVLEGREMLGAFIQRVQEQGCPQMLPDILCAGTDEGGLPAVGRSISQKLTERSRRIEVAGRERLLCRLACSVPASREPSLPLLSIVVSTYNRARFVEENVRWLLHVLRQFPKDVHLTVVDNASTDDTAERLAKFARNSRLTLITNPVNLGMLGNLRACASLIGVRHVWITGDDDFIVPSGLAEIYAALKANPELPFAFVNFGVYRRSALGQGDTAKRLIAERVPLSARTARSGVYPIRYIAEQHDNLFTAFYPIIFRSDLLAACFNYPFDGKPFIDLVESVPTTKMLLETYADTDAYWCAQIGTVGNVANSWSRHLPRWHAVLMPRILKLARDVGVDPTKLGEWSNLHFDLFREAKKVAEREGEALDIQPHELDVASHVFRRPIVLG
jgi:glycosyltransferase involved in cell wall biosynthesis